MLVDLSGHNVVNKKTLPVQRQRSCSDFIIRLVRRSRAYIIGEAFYVSAEAEYIVDVKIIFLIGTTIIGKLGKVKLCFFKAELLTDLYDLVRRKTVAF